MTLHRIDPVQRLYIIAAGSGYTTLGFDVAHERMIRYYNWLKEQGYQGTWGGADESIKGTERGYWQYVVITALTRIWCDLQDVICTADLIPELVGLEGKLVEVEEENGSVRKFYVGRSFGQIPCHIETEKPTDRDGPAVLPYKRLLRVEE